MTILQWNNRRGGDSLSLTYMKFNPTRSYYHTNAEVTDMTNLTEMIDAGRDYITTFILEF